MPSSRRAWILAFCGAYLAALVVIVVVAGRGGTNEMFGFVTHVPFGDKVGHFVLIGGLGLGADVALRFRDWRFRSWRGVPIGPAVVMVVALLEELSQIALPTRSFDLVDLAADALGIAAFTALGRRLIRRADEGGPARPGDDRA